MCKYSEISMGLFHTIITLVIIVCLYKPAESKMTIEQIKNTMKPYKNKCIKNTGVDPDIVEATKKGSWSSERNLMCFTKCIFNMVKIIKEGDISLEATFAAVDLMVPDEIVPRMKEVLEVCFEQAVSTVKDPKDLCEKSWLFTKCFQLTDNSLYFFP